MANRVQRLRHTTTSLANFTGLEAEITVNLSNNSLIVHDGITPGGHEVALANLTNVNAATTVTSGKMTDQHVRDLALALQSTILNAANIVINSDAIAVNLISINNQALAIAQNAADISALSGGQGSYLLLAGGTMTGPVILAADPVVNLEPATKQYTDTGDALAESNAITHANNLAASLEASKANRAGDTFTGPVILAADPVGALEAATRQFVLSEIAGAVAPTRTAGDRLCGFISMNFSLLSTAARAVVITAPVGGVYRFKVAVRKLTGDIGDHVIQILIYINGAYAGQTENSATLQGLIIPQNSIVLSNNFDLAAAVVEGDVIDFRVRTTTGGGNSVYAVNGVAVYAAEIPIAVPMISEPVAAIFTP